MTDNLHLLQTILNNIQEAVYVLNKNGEYIYANRAYCDYVGASFDVIKQYSAHDLLRLGYINYCIYDKVCETKSEVTVFHEAFLPKNSVPGYADDRSFSFLVTSTPVFDSEGNIEYIVSIELQLSMLNTKFRTASLNRTNRSKKLPFSSDTSTRIIAESVSFRQVLSLARAVADSDASVLLQGETGSGKDFLASYIHSISKRSAGPFVAINCASMPKDLLEAELFGYAPGAFTGANAKGKAGLIEAASGGTLFLDEINSLPLELQGKLLRFLETRQVTRLGEVKSRTIDFRVLSATNQDLNECVNSGTFRSDLYYRLNVIPISVPPLRRRKEDIPPLIYYFLDYYSSKYHRAKYLSPDVVARLTEYAWPGNVRELKNLMERLVVISSIPDIELSELPAEISALPSAEDSSGPHTAVSDPDAGLLSFSEPYFYDESLSLKKNMDLYEISVIKQAVRKYGSLSKAAAVLGSSKATLSRKLNNAPD